MRDPNGSLAIAGAGRLQRPALVVHGGAGPRRSHDISEADRQRYRDALTAALRTGERLLSSGGDAVAAVAAVAVMEDSGVLNAGRGSVRRSRRSAATAASSR
jgi:beta-aspartyl-peptidase (threonine type)